MSQFGEDFDDDDFDICGWLLCAPTEELIRVMADGTDARWRWARQLLAIRRLDESEVTRWA